MSRSRDSSIDRGDGVVVVGGCRGGRFVPTISVSPVLGGGVGDIIRGGGFLPMINVFWVGWVNGTGVVVVDEISIGGNWNC